MATPPLIFKRRGNALGRGAMSAALLHHHRHSLRQRRAAYRPRLRAHRHRRDPALHAARRARDAVRHRHGRARAEGAADRGARGRDAAGVRRRHRRPSSRRWAKLLNARADDIVRTTQPRHARPCRRSGSAWQANGDIYLSKYSGWYSVRDEAYFDEGELTDGAGRRQARAERRAGAMGRGGELFLPASPPTPTGCSRITRPTPISSRRRNTATRSSPS